MKEIEAIKSGNIKSSSFSNNNKKQPSINYSSTSLSERKKWSFKRCNNLPTPNSSQVKNW